MSESDMVCVLLRPSMNYAGVEAFEFVCSERSTKNNEFSGRNRSSTLNTCPRPMIGLDYWLSLGFGAVF